MGYPFSLLLSPMLSERHAGGVVVWAPAKVNLFLEVLARRADGYHEITTLMVAVSLFDTLEFKEDHSGDIRLSADHPLLPTGSENLIVRAAALLRQRVGVDRGVQIRLKKRIPLAAGLAGGSTDAAATLIGLNRLWGLRLSAADLTTLGAEVGSDVPFFLHTPAAWCTGRGERVEPVVLGAALWFVLVCPPTGLSTAEVYRGVVVPESPCSGDEMRQAVREGRVQAIGDLLHNRLQPAAERLCPAVGEMLSRLATLNAVGRLMSGSGSTLYALCRDRQEAIRIARQLRHGSEERPRSRVFIVRTCV